MCGGRGTRLDSAVEKSLFRVDGVPLVDRVCDALAESRVETVYAVVSPHAPGTREHVRERDCAVIETPGEGYVADLGTALADPRVTRPVLTCAADLPLLAAALVDETIAEYERRAADSLTVAVPRQTKELLGVSVDTTMSHEGREVAPAGLNVVGDGEREAVWVSSDVRLAVNLNRRGDARVAEQLCDGSGP
jgi:adenosylcobinamide-phosphate guanylyltransferase